MKAFKPLHKIIPCLAAALLAAVSSNAHAATKTWVGNTDANFATSANWTPSAVTANDTLTFGANGTAGTSLSNNLAFNTGLQGLTFSAGASAYTISGNQSTASLPAAGGWITNSSSNLQTVNLNLFIASGGNRFFDTGSAGINYGGTIMGSASVGKNGAGTLTLSNYNSYSATTAINAGILSVSDITDGGIGAKSTGVITAGSNTVQMNAFAGIVAGQYINNDNFAAGTTVVSINGSGLATLSSNAITSAGNGTSTTFSKSQLGSSTVALNGGTLQYTGANATSNQVMTIPTAGTAINANLGGGTSSGNGTIEITNAATNLTLSSTIALPTGGSLIKTGSGTLTLTPLLSGGGGLTVNAGTLNLATGLNSFTGNVTLNAGVLKASSTTSANTRNANLGTGASVLNLNGGELLLAQNTAATFSRNTTVGGNVTITADRNVGGAGTTYTFGTLAIGAQTLNANAGALATGASSVTFGATTLSGAATFNVNNNTGTMALILGTVDNGGNLLTFTGNATGASGTVGAISGSGGLTKNGGGTLNLGATNSYLGATTLNQGTLNATAATLGSAASALAVNNTNTGAGTNVILNLNTSADTTTGSFSGSISAPSSGTNTATINTGGAGRSFTVNQTSSGSYAGVIAGAGNFAMGSGSNSTLTLSGTNTYNGTTTVSAGTLIIGGGGSINSSSAVNVSAGSKLAYNSSVALTKAPTLNGAGSGSRAILGGTGTINAAVTLDNLGDTLAPGNSPGIQSFAVSQTWNSFTYLWETNNFTGTTAGTDFDQISITGSLNLTGGSGAYVLDLNSLTAGNAPGNVGGFSDVNRTWTILTTTTGITGFNASNWTIATTNFTSSPAWTGAWSITQSVNDLTLNYTAVPEPSTWFLVALSGTFFMVMRRRRQS